MNNSYSDKQKIEIANKYLEGGQSQVQLAKEYNLHYNTIKKYVKCIRNNIPINRKGIMGKRTKKNRTVLSNELKEKIALEHLENGIAIKDLVIKYDCDRVSIINYVKNIRNGTQMYEKGKSKKPKVRSTKNLTNEDKVKIANEYIQGGISQKELALKYEISICSVSNYVKRVENGITQKDVGAKKTHQMVLNDDTDDDSVN